MDNMSPAKWVRVLCVLILCFFASFAYAGEHVVVPGDSLSRIAAKHAVVGGWNALYEVNKDVVKNPHLIYPGQRLSLPDGASVAVVRREKKLAPSVPPKKEARDVVPQLQALQVSVAPVVSGVDAVASSVAVSVQAIKPMPAPIAEQVIVSANVAPNPEVATSVVSAPVSAGTVASAKTSENLAQGPPPADAPNAVIMEPLPTQVVAVDSDAKPIGEPKDARTTSAATTSVVDDFNDPRNWKPVIQDGSSANPPTPVSLVKTSQYPPRSIYDELKDPVMWRVVTPEVSKPAPISKQVSESAPESLKAAVQISR